MASDSLFPDRRPGGDGILPSQEIRDLIDSGKILGAGIAEEQIQPSSIDLRLANQAYRVHASFLPGKAATLLSKAKTSGMLIETIDISNPTLLERDAIHIVPLMESLALPPSVYGIANPKSSTGRLDIFTRLISEYGDEFERVPRGYCGGLYIEVVSQTFPILIQAGMKLNQLRFGRGRRDFAGDDRLRQLGLVDNTDEDTGQVSIDRGLRITVDLQGCGSGIVAYKAKRTSTPIDLGKIDYYDAAEFWEPIYKNGKRQFILQPREFYILASKQRIRVPADLAAELLPYDLASQEFRVHYAGFFDPGFGYGEDGKVPGTRAVLEVRASHMPILLEDDQFVGRLNYYNMASTPHKVYGGAIGSSYQRQGLALSKQFKRDTVAVSRPASIVASLSRDIDEDLPPMDALTSQRIGNIDDREEKAVLKLDSLDILPERSLAAKNPRSM